MDNKEILTVVASLLGVDLEDVLSSDAMASKPSEPRYIIYVGKKPRNVKAPYIAINADGQLSGFTEEADVLGEGTDRIGKWTKAEIEEKFPQFNHEAFLVEVD